MNYIKIENPENKDHCYCITTFSDKTNMKFLDRLFDENFKIHKSTEDIINKARDKGSFLVWEFTESKIDEERLQRMIDELKWVNGAKLTFG